MWLPHLKKQLFSILNILLNYYLLLALLRHRNEVIQSLLKIELNTLVLLRKVYNTVVLIFMWIGFGQVCVGCVYGILTAAGRGVARGGAADRGDAGLGGAGHAGYRS